MQQVRESMSEITTNRGGNDAPIIVRTDLSSLLSDYTNSQQRYNNRLESLEREIASLKGHVNHAFPSSEDDELNRTYTIKKSPVSPPTSARLKSPSRIPLPITPRKSIFDDKSAISNNETRSLPSLSINRSKSFHNNNTNTISDETTTLRSYKTRLEQLFYKDRSQIPNYTSMEDVIKANEQLLIENDRLRSELNRLKTESILLIRSMKANTTATGGGNESHLGNERIMAERERQELAMELARQVEENKRLRKSLLAQSTKFVTLRQSTNMDHRPTTGSVSNSSRVPQTKSARSNRSFGRSNTFNHTSQDPV